MQVSTRRFYWLLGLITVLGLGIRLFYAVHTKWDQTIWGDAFQYHYTANGIADGLGFQTWLPNKLLGHSQQFVLNLPVNGGHGAHPIGATADHPPLPALFYAAFSVLGMRSFHWHMLAGVGLGTISVFMMGILGRKIAGDRVGLIAAILAAVYANFWVYDPLVTSESLAILATIVFVFVAYRAWEEPTWARLAWVGVAGGMAALTRAELLMLLPVVGLPLVIRRLAGHAIKERVTLLAVAAVASLLIMSPWLIRNLTLWDHPETLSSSPGLALLVSSCDTTYYGQFLGWWSPQCVGAKRPKGDPSEQDAYWRSRAFDYMGSHLDRLPVVMLARFGRMWELYHPGSPWGPFQGNQKINFDIVEGRSQTAARIALAQYYLLVPFTIAGVVIMKRRKTVMMPLLATVIVASITAIYSFGNTRYRSTAEVAIVAFSAIAIDALIARFVRRRAPTGPEPPREVEYATASVG